MNAVLRNETEADAAFLLSLYASTREEELRQLSWPIEARTAFVRQQFQAQTAHYREHFADDSFQIIEVDGEAAGRLYVGRWDGEIRIIDIALLPGFAARGSAQNCCASSWRKRTSRGSRCGSTWK